MTQYDDLSPCDYFGSAWSSTLLSVGWLGSDVQSCTRLLEDDFFRALIVALEDPWGPVAIAGRHRCEVCRFSGGPGEVSYEGRTVRVGSNNLFVFDSSRAYVAPSLIVHYIDAHGYVPPTEFQVALIRSPAMKSFAYLKQVRAFGLHKFPR